MTLLLLIYVHTPHSPHAKWSTPSGPGPCVTHRWSLYVPCTLERVASNLWDEWLRRGWQRCKQVSLWFPWDLLLMGTEHCVCFPCGRVIYRSESHSLPLAYYPTPQREELACIQMDGWVIQPGLTASSPSTGPQGPSVAGRITLYTITRENIRP